MKQLMIIFCMLSTIQLFPMNLFTSYKRLSSLQNSSIRRKCLLCKNQWFRRLIWSNQNIKKECDLLEKKLENIATTGGYRIAGDSYWSWIQTAAQNKSQKSIRQAVHTILTDESETVKNEELVKLSKFAHQLAHDYDLLQAAKEEQKLKILEQLKVEELRMVVEEKKDNNLTIHRPIRYPHINNMFDSHIKQVCLNCKSGLFIKGFIEKSCDKIEDDLSKISTNGYIEHSLFHITTFEDKEKEHENDIKKILPHLSDNIRYSKSS